MESNLVVNMQNFITIFFALFFVADAFHHRPFSFQETRGITKKINIRSISNLYASINKPEFALLFDCDGVIVETEELHRLAYNMAFKKFDLSLPNGKKVEWDVEYYDKLQNTVGGGKPKMNYYFNEEVRVWPTYQGNAAPSTATEKSKLVDDLQDSKTEFYIKIVEEVAKARPGVLELMDAAIADPSIYVGICSAATKAGFEKIVNSIVGQERLSKLDVIMAGDDVKLKKPDPMIYNMAREKLELPSSKCVVIEDSLVGLKAAKAAGMRCIISYTDSTASEDFYLYGADAKVPDLSQVTLDSILKSLKSASQELLESVRDKK